MMHLLKTRQSNSPKIQGRERVSQLTSGKYGISHPASIPVSGRNGSQYRGCNVGEGTSASTILSHTTSQGAGTGREDTHVLFRDKSLIAN